MVQLQEEKKKKRLIRRRTSLLQSIPSVTPSGVRQDKTTSFMKCVDAKFLLVTCRLQISSWTPNCLRQKASMELLQYPARQRVVGVSRQRSLRRSS
jgi:hypothetical protein